MRTPHIALLIAASLALGVALPVVGADKLLGVVTYGNPDGGACTAVNIKVPAGVTVAMQCGSSASPPVAQPVRYRTGDDAGTTVSSSGTNRGLLVMDSLSLPFDIPMKGQDNHIAVLPDPCVTDGGCGFYRKE